MKKITELFIVLACLISSSVIAQDGYTYTLVDNGSYSFTIAAVPNTSTNNFATSVQSYGFTIIVPDGVTLTLSSSLGGGASSTLFDGNNVGEPSIDGYLITETLGSPASLPAPSAGMNSNFVTVQINGSPTNGLLYILENNSALANSVTPLKSFMQADMEDDGMAIFTNKVDPNASAVTAPSSFDFSTLSIDDKVAKENLISIYPIPADKEITVESNVKIESFSIYDFSGKQVIQDSTFTIGKNIDVSRLATGVYLLKLKMESTDTITRQIIKK